MRFLILFSLAAIGAAVALPPACAQTNAPSRISVTREADLWVPSDQERRYWAMNVTRTDLHVALWSIPNTNKPWTIEIVNGFSMTNSPAAVKELQEVLNKYEEWSGVAKSNAVGAVTRLIKRTQTASGERDFRFVVANDQPPLLSISDGPDLSPDDVEAIEDLLEEYPAAVEEWNAKASAAERATELFR